MSKYKIEKDYLGNTILQCVYKINSNKHTKENYEKLMNQINNVHKFIFKQLLVLPDEIKFIISHDGDDFVNNKKTLIITYIYH